MRYAIAILLLTGSASLAAITDSPHLRDRVDHYIGRVTTQEDYTLDALNRKAVKVLGWDARRLGKPAPTDDAQLVDDATAAAWKASLKTDAEKEREKVDSTDKLQAEVIALRKELEALKKGKP